MEFHRHGTPAKFAELAGGECFTFSLDGKTNVGLAIKCEVGSKSILCCAAIWPGLADYKGVPGILEADVLTRNPVCVLSKAKLIPDIDPKEVSHGMEGALDKPGSLVITPKAELLVVRDNKNNVLVDVTNGTFHSGGLDKGYVTYSAWRVVCPGVDEHQLVCEFRLRD